ncbi:MAG: flavodoxin family protein [Candidatus Ranarchaeia archaeon]|jgi:multimeric flavodoxin WrbA
MMNNTQKHLSHPLHLLIVSTSPRDEASTFVGRELIKAAKTEAQKLQQPIEVKLLNVSDTKLQLCDRCDLCLDPDWRVKSNRYCKLDDGLEKWYPKIEACNGIVLIAPCYMHAPPGLCLAFIDRLRPIKQCIHNGTKCGQVIAIGGSRTGGQGSVIMDLKELIVGTWIIPIPSLEYQGGGNIWSGYKGKKDEHKFGSGWQGARDHEEGIREVHEIGKYMVHGIRLLRAGYDALGLKSFTK